MKSTSKWYLRERQKRKKIDKPLCPICVKEMTRKGKKGKEPFFKCKRCGGTYSGGQFQEKKTDIQSLEYNRQLVVLRKQEQVRKLVKKLKKEKYLPYKTFEWDGKVINLDEYDVDGVPLKEKEKEKEKMEGMEKEKEDQENVLQ